MKAFRTLFVASVTMLRRNRVLLITSLGLALLSIFVFGWLFGSGGTPKLELGVVDHDTSPLSQQMTQGLRASDSLQVFSGTQTEELRALRDGHRNAVIVLESGFGQALTQGKSTNIEVYYDQSSPVMAANARMAVQSIVTSINQQVTHQAGPVTRRAKLIMTAHIGLPALDGPDPPPATLSPGVLQGLLRRELRFAGVIITDALDMHAIQQGEALGGEALRAVQAGADLLLVTSNPIDQFRVHAALQAGPLNAGMLRASLRRISKLKNWIARRPKRPDLSVIASPRHLQAADEIAQASITLVRDDIALLPLRLAPDERVAVILPRPRDLTPADTSSYVAPRLANALREYQPDVAELLIPYDPQPADVGALLQTLQDYDLIVVGTLNAFEQQGQAALVRALLGAHPRTIVAALRLPYDLAAFPEAPCYLCTYSLLEPSMRALAAVIFGEATPRGHLPVSIPGLYAAGAGLHR